MPIDDYPPEKNLRLASELTSTIGIKKSKAILRQIQGDKSIDFYYGMFRAFESMMIVLESMKSDKELNSLKCIDLMADAPKDFAAIFAKIIIEKLDDYKKYEIAWETININDENVKYDISLSYNEAIKAYLNRLYISSIVLCGKVIEIAIHFLYEKNNNEELLDKYPGIGLGKALGKLRKQGFKFPEEIDSTVNLINKYRNAYIHKKTASVMPNDTQAEAIILLVKNFLTKYINE